MQVAAHLGWLTGMDLASGSGLLLSCGEDGWVRVWQLSAAGRHPVAEHRFSTSIGKLL